MTFSNFVNRIRFGLGYCFSSIYFWFITVLLRVRYWLIVAFLVIKKCYIASVFFIKRIVYFIQAIILFLPSYFTKNEWINLNKYLTYRIRMVYNLSIKNWLISFANLKKKRADFVELYQKRTLQLYIHLLARHWPFLEFDLSLFRRLTVHGLYTTVESYIRSFFRQLLGVFYGVREEARYYTLSFYIMRNGYRLQFELDSLQLAKRSRDPLFLTDNNMLYVRYYYPFTYNPDEGGYTMHITDIFKNDVLPAGPDLLDFEAYFEFDGTPPFPYEEESWDLGFSIPDRFRSWLNHTTYFGTKTRVAKLMMDYELYQLHMDLDELLLQMKDRNSASYIGATGVDEYVARFRTLKPESTVPTLVSKVGWTDKFWDEVHEKLEDNPYAGFSTIQTFSFIGAQIGGALLIGLALVFFIHGEYESFIRVHAPWLLPLHYTKIFYRNSTYFHYSTHWFAQRWWMFLYQGSWLSSLTDPTYYHYLFGRIRSNGIWFITALVGVRGGYPSLHPTFKSRFRGFDDDIWRSAFLRWNREPYTLGKSFDTIESYRFIKNSNDVYFANFPLPSSGLNVQSWASYLMDLIIQGLEAVGAVLSFSLVIPGLIIFALFFFFVKLIWFRLFPSSYFGSGDFYLALSPYLSSVLPYVKNSFKSLSPVSNPFAQLAIKTEVTRSCSMLELARFRAAMVNTASYYDYFIYPAIEDILAFKFNYLNVGREYLYMPEFNSLYAYTNWIGWYSPTIEDDQMDEDNSFLTEEAEDEEDDSDEPGTDTDYELEFGLTSFHYGVKAPLYSSYFSSVECRYFDTLVFKSLRLPLNSYRRFLVEDFELFFNTAIGSRTAFYLFLLSFNKSIPASPSPVVLNHEVLNSPRYRQFLKRLYNLQLSASGFNFRLFELNDITLPTMIFPTPHCADSVDLIITYNDIHFTKRASFVNTLLSAHWYKCWLQFFFYGELSVYFHFLSLQLRSHESVFRNDPILRDLPANLEENYSEIYYMLEEDLDELILDTNTYPLDFIASDSESDNELKLHNWFENAITMKLGHASSVFAYDLPFMFYTNNDRQELVYSLNDFYWAANTMKTWIPVVPEEEIDYIQYMVFPQTVSLGAYFFNGFYATLYEGFLSDDSLVLNRASEARFAADEFHPGYNIYSFNQLEVVGAWPYGLGVNQLDRAVVETTMRRLESTDPDAMDWVNFSTMDLQQFPHLTYEQRMYMLLDWKMRQFINLYVMFDIQNSDAADAEILEYYSFEPWLADTELWVIFPATHTYDSIW